MTRHIEASSNGATSINELSRNYPGEWVAVRVVGFDSEGPSAGILLKSSPKPHEVVQAIQDARNRGFESLSTLRGTTVPTSDDFETANALAVEEFLELAEFELRKYAEPGKISSFAKHTVDDYFSEASAVLSDPLASYNELPLGRPASVSDQADRRVLAAMLMSSRGSAKGLVCLAASLLTEEINQKITILDFLTSLTAGHIGNGQDFPTKKHVLDSCRALYELAESKAAKD